MRRKLDTPFFILVRFYSLPLSLFASTWKTVAKGARKSNARPRSRSYLWCLCARPEKQAREANHKTSLRDGRSNRTPISGRRSSLACARARAWRSHSSENSSPVLIRTLDHTAASRDNPAETTFPRSGRLQHESEAQSAGQGPADGMPMGSLPPHFWTKKRSGPRMDRPKINRYLYTYTHMRARVCAKNVYIINVTVQSRLKHRIGSVKTARRKHGAQKGRHSTLYTLPPDFGMLFYQFLKALLTSSGIGWSRER